MPPNSPAGPAADLPRSSEPQALLWMLQSAMPFNANPDLHYGDWVARGYAIWHATGGTQDGFALFDDFSQKSAKYDARNTETVWQAIGKACRGGSPPVTAGAGTIFFHAKAGGWKRPPITTDPNYTASLTAAAEAQATRGAGRPEVGGPPPQDPTPQPEPPDEEQPPPQHEDDDFVLPIEFSENMLAYTFSRQHAHHLVYVHGWGKWMRYEAGRWREDHAVTVFDGSRRESG
jgi:Primase C terminal 2 (PriCT-2)